MAFLPANRQRTRDADVTRGDACDLRTILNALSRAIRTGRADVAVFFARSAARWCGRQSTNNPKDGA